MNQNYIDVNNVEMQVNQTTKETQTTEEEEIIIYGNKSMVDADSDDVDYLKRARTRSPIQEVIIKVKTKAQINYMNYIGNYVSKLSEFMRDPAATIPDSISFDFDLPHSRKVELLTKCHVRIEEDNDIENVAKEFKSYVDEKRAKFKLAEINKTLAVTVTAIQIAKKKPLNIIEKSLIATEFSQKLKKSLLEVEKNIGKLLRARHRFLQKLPTNSKLFVEADIVTIMKTTSIDDVVFCKKECISCLHDYKDQGVAMVPMLSYSDADKSAETFSVLSCNEPIVFTVEENDLIIPDYENIDKIYNTLSKLNKMNDNIIHAINITEIASYKVHMSNLAWEKECKNVQ
jgi:hypothetical protein